MNENTLKIRWLGHSCFELEYRGFSIILDPYADGKVDGLPPLRAEGDLVLCSHGHDDHNARENVTLRKNGADNPFKIYEINTYHDSERGAKRGKNTIRVFEAGALRAAHLGDLGCKPEPEQLEALRGLDAVMIPVGGFFTIDAREARRLVDEIRPRVVIPMHYRSADFGFDVLGTVDEYLSLVDNAVFYDSDTLLLATDTPPQTAVLRLGAR